MRTGRPKEPLDLTDEERHKLETLARRATTTQRLATRAKIVLLCAQGRTNRDVAKYLHADWGLLAQHGRAVLRRDHGQAPPP